MNIIDETIKRISGLEEDYGDYGDYDELFDEIETTREQEEYFRNSVIRDEEGNLLVVYHGSPETFDEFDKSKIKRGSSGGDGFYFTPIKSDAVVYSIKDYEPNTVRCCFLNITNPYINKYGSEETATLQQQALEQGITFEELLQKQGYDGIILLNYGRDIFYIAFEPNQIKSIFNLHPTKNNRIDR